MFTRIPSVKYIVLRQKSLTLCQYTMQTTGYFLNKGRKVLSEGILQCSLAEYATYHPRNYTLIYYEISNN